MNKSKLRQVIFLSLVFFLIVSVFLDMKYFSTKRHKTRVEIIDSEAIPDSFDNVSIGFFSDVLSNYENLDKTIESLNNQNIDIVLFGGNLLSEEVPTETKEDLIEKLKKINAPLGKYAVLGEEDLSNQSYEILEQAEFRHLTASGSKIYNFKDEHINLVGLDSEQLKYESKDGVFEILLVNDAKTIDDIDENIFDLVLAGKYLGGQFKLPFFEPFGEHATYYKKRSNLDNKTIILSQGLGTYDLDMRLNTNPETIVIILRKINNES